MCTYFYNTYKSIKTSSTTITHVLKKIKHIISMEIIQQKFRLYDYKIPRITIKLRKFSIKRNKWKEDDTYKPFAYGQSFCCCQYPTKYCNGKFIAHKFYILNIFISFVRDRFGFLCERQFMIKNEKPKVILDRDDILTLIMGLQPLSMEAGEILHEKFDLGEFVKYENEVFDIFKYKPTIIDGKIMFAHNIELMSNHHLLDLYSAIKTDDIEKMKEIAKTYNL